MHTILDESKRIMLGKKNKIPNITYYVIPFI